MNIWRLNLGHVARRLHDPDVQIMITNRNLLRKSARQVGDARANYVTILRRSHIEPRKRILVERKSPPKMLEHGRRIRPDNIDQKTPRFFHQFPCRTPLSQRNTDGRWIKRSLLKPRHQHPRRPPTLLNGQYRTSAGNPPQRRPDCISKGRQSTRFVPISIVRHGRILSPATDSR